MTKATNPERPMLYADEHILTNNYSIKVSSIPSIKINKSRFMNSIIQNTGYDDVLLTCLEWDGSEPKSTSDEKFFRGGKNSDLIANGNMASLAGSVSYIGDRTVALDRSTKRGRVSTEEVMVSNFPEFVYKIADMMWGHIEDGARLKPLEYYPLTGILVVSTSSRKCRLKAIHYGVPEASHKSGEKSGNCAYYVVDTKNRIWYQKCFSTKEPCKGKKTENFQIESKYTELLDRVDAERAKLIQSEESAANFLCIFEQIRRKSQSVDG